MARRFNFHVTSSIARRDLKMYFSNPTGYVFITLFIFLSAAAAFWQERFFLNNLANLDQLNAVFPYLLLFFVPALTMSVWSEERKLGTDELLLTLPASDVEVVLGKYLAALGIYTASLLLSLSHVLVLFWLGRPDVGLMFGNYVGYWLLGAALIAIGMLASLLTANATIAFILGALFCSAIVMIEPAAAVFSDKLAEWVRPLGVFYHFADFAKGVITLSGLVYFAALAGVALYLNIALVGRRHWPAKAEGMPMWAHYTVRTLSLIVAMVGLVVLISRAHVRLDVTAERLHTLSDETEKLLSELSEDRPVFIQAFISPEVPEQYVQARTNILNILREIDARAGGKVHVVVKDTELYSEDARVAREQFGITPRKIPNVSSARTSVMDVFMGLAFTCGAEERVIPFFDRGLPAEYEIVRSIRTVSRTEREKIGVINTALRVFGGLDFNTMRTSPSWSVVEELKKQYEVVQITPSSPITEEMDGMVVFLPSSMPQEEMDNVAEMIEAGVPTMLLIDPLPIVDPMLAPVQRAGANENPFMRQGRPPPKPKGDIEKFLANLGIRWNKGRVVWDTYNPHPDLAHLPPEVVFLGRGNGNEETFNPDDPTTSRLQEVVFLYPGTVESTVGDGFEFVPLLKTGLMSGENHYSAYVKHSLFGATLNPYAPHRPTRQEYVLAARVTAVGDKATDDPEGEEKTEEDAKAGQEDASRSRVIVVADVDFISEQFFQIRKLAPGNLNFDNVTFFLNCIDVLVGDTSFLALRNRRVKHRTLERVEAQTRQFVERRVQEEQAAEAEADKALKEAQQRLDEKVAKVREAPDLDERAKQIAARNLQEVENRRFEVLKANIEAEKDLKIQRSKEEMESQIRRIQGTIRTTAVLLPPIPVFVLGVAIFIRRRNREREGAAASKRLRA